MSALAFRKRAKPGKDSVRVGHLCERGADKTYCGLRIPETARTFRSEEPWPPHQLCVVCADLAGAAR